MSRIKSRWVLGLVLGGAFVVAVRSRQTESAWQKIVANGRALERSVDAVDLTRPVLRGEPIEGDAMPAYKRAMELLSDTIADDWFRCVEARNAQDGTFAAHRDIVVDAHGPMLAALARGARHTNGQESMDWRQLRPMEIPSLLNTRHVANIMVLTADQHLDRGQPELAVDVLLDGMQLSGDVMRGPFVIQGMIGIALFAITTNEALVQQGMLDRIPPPQLVRLAEGMAKLDASLPDMAAARDAEVALLVRRLSEAEWGAAGLLSNPVEWLGSWRHGFSPQARTVQWVGELEVYRARQRPLAELSWPEQGLALAAIEEDSKGSQNPLLAPHVTIWASTERALRNSLTQFRFARIAVEYRATGKATALPDPFGDELTITELEHLLRIESLGDPKACTRGREVLEIARL